MFLSSESSHPSLQHFSSCLLIPRVIHHESMISSRWHCRKHETTAWKNPKWRPFPVSRRAQTVRALRTRLALLFCHGQQPRGSTSVAKTIKRLEARLIERPGCENVNSLPQSSSSSCLVLSQHFNNRWTIKLPDAFVKAYRFSRYRWDLFKIMVRNNYARFEDPRSNQILG